MLASTCDALSSLRIFTWIELLARYPVIVEFSPYCGCRLTCVVLMSLASMPPLRARRGRPSAGRWSGSSPW